jgi:hypothetical protein
MPENEWTNLLLIAAKDLQVLIAILFFLGIILIVISIVDVSKYGVKAENKRLALLSGIIIASLSGLMMIALFTNSMAVDVSGVVKNSDGTPVRNVIVSIGDRQARTNGEGSYIIPEVPRNKSQINVIIKNKKYPETLNIPCMCWDVSKDIIIYPINLSIEGDVYDENGNPVNGAWVNLSWEKDLSSKTDFYGKFDFGYQQVPFAPTKPLRLFVRLNRESKPRNIEVLEIPSEDPYDIYHPVTLMPKDWVNVTGTVILKENESVLIGTEFPDISVKMGDGIARSGADGHYCLSRVPINTTNYSITTNDGRVLANHTIYPLLREGVEMPRIVDLFVYKDQLIGKL